MAIGMGKKCNKSTMPLVILNKSDLEKKIDESDIKKYIDADICVA